MKLSCPKERTGSASPESEARFRQLADHAREVFWISSADEHQVTYINPAFEEIFGRSRQTLEQQGIDWMDCVHPEDRTRVASELAGHAGHPYCLEHRILRPDRSIRWVRVRTVPLQDPSGTISRIAGFAEDITERKLAEESLRSLSGELLRSQDDERRRIARELHDTTVQKLAALSMNLGLLETLLPWMDPKPKKLLRDGLALVEQCASELRTLAYLLHPPLLEDLGLAGAVRDYADGFARRSGLRVDLELSEDLERLSREAELTLFRVLQESLANVHRHSGSRTASIRLLRLSHAVFLEITDTGHGLKNAARPGGHGAGVGLSGMRERLRQLNGSLEVDSSSKGTKVTALVPMEPPPRFETVGPSGVDCGPC